MAPADEPLPGAEDLFKSLHETKTPDGSAMAFLDSMAPLDSLAPLESLRPPTPSPAAAETDADTSVPDEPAAVDPRPPRRLPNGLRRRLCSPWPSGRGAGGEGNLASKPDPVAAKADAKTLAAGQSTAAGPSTATAVSPKACGRQDCSPRPAGRGRG